MKRYVKDKTVFQDDIDIHVQYMSFKYEPIHTHDFFEFVYMLSGTMNNIINGVSYQLKEGSIAMIDCDQTHEIIAKDEDKIAYINILVTKDFISNGEVSAKNIYDLFSFVALQQVKKNDMIVPVFSFEGSEKTEFKNLVLSMMNEYNSKNENYDKILAHYFYILILKLLRHLNYSKKNNLIVDLDSKISEIMEYIDKNYNKDINLSEISERFFYNSSYFSRLFKKLFGITFNSYLQDLRIKKSLSLIDKTDYSMEKISEEVGYTDKKQFYFVFKKKMGITPGAYKRNVAKKNNVKNAH